MSSPSRRGASIVALAISSVAAIGCQSNSPTEHHAFVTTLGNDTIAVENVWHSGNKVTTHEVDRFPRVHERRTEITLAPDGGIQHLAMEIVTPSAPEKQRTLHVVADVNKDSIIMTKRDDSTNLRWSFPTGGETVMAHVPQMYSLYELYFAAGLKRIAARGANAGAGADTARFRQFYIDREFDRFPTHHGVVRKIANGKAEITHDWLSGTGEATVDSNFQMQHYSGARTTYLVDVTRLSDTLDIHAIATQYAATEAKNGGVKQLSVRDTTRASIGAASFTVDYGRPLARGRKLVGNVIPFDYVWRTGANAATQFSTSAPITLGTLKLAPGKYTLWTVPRANGNVALIVNKQTGQWGTDYDRAQDLGTTPLKVEAASAPVEEFTISIPATDARSGMLVMEWGDFRWSVPIVVGG